MMIGFSVVFLSLLWQMMKEDVSTDTFDWKTEWYSFPPVGKEADNQCSK